jgi:hypothetical protein
MTVRAWMGITAVLATQTSCADNAEPPVGVCEPIDRLFLVETADGQATIAEIMITGPCSHAHGCRPTQRDGGVPVPAAAMCDRVWLKATSAGRCDVTFTATDGRQASLNFDVTRVLTNVRCRAGERIVENMLYLSVRPPDARVDFGPQDAAVPPRDATPQ